MFTVELLPASDGDCIWVEWGESPQVHRMLIDAGRARSKQRLPLALEARIEALPLDQRVFDLVVATHIDVDHVHGLVPLFASPPDGFRAKEVWFNGRGHLPDDKLGHKDGNRLTEGLLATAGNAWNASWRGEVGGAVVVPDCPAPLPVRHVEGLEIVLLSPTLDALRGLLTVWPEVVASAGLEAEHEQAPGDVLGEPTRDVGTPLHTLATMTDDEADSSPSNGSSIAFLASYEGRTVLFGADAHAGILTDGLSRVANGKTVHVDVCKVPHHGSRKNVKPELLELLDCNLWLVSTNGDKHNHPDRRGMARILAREHQTLVFNYDCPSTAEYARFAVKNEFDSLAYYPAAADGIRVDVVQRSVVAG